MDYLKSMTLLLVLLNPFLVIVYLMDVVEKLSFIRFSRILMRAALISLIVFFVFAVLGDAVFSDIVHARFASFQIFGGVVFLLIGIKFVLRGDAAIEVLRGESEQLAGAIAMPVLIGPGTISASVIVGRRHDLPTACAAILLAVFLTVVIMMGLKRLHDYVRPRSEPLVQRYIEITGRITALFVGTVSVEMIMRGIAAWIDIF
jgi:multiple antibiotic resistance protein